MKSILGAPVYCLMYTGSPLLKIHEKVMYSCTIRQVNGGGGAMMIIMMMTSMTMMILTMPSKIHEFYSLNRSYTVVPVNGGG